MALGDSDSTKLDQTEAIRLFGESDCFTFVPKIVVFESVMSRLQFGVMTIELQSCLQNLMQKCSRSRGNPVVQSPQNPGFHQGDDVPCAQYWVMVVVWPTFGRGSSVLYHTPPPTHMYQLPNGRIHKSRKDVYDNTVKIEKCFPGFNQVKLTYVLTWTDE